MKSRCLTLNLCKRELILSNALYVLEHMSDDSLQNENKREWYQPNNSKSVIMQTACSKRPNQEIVKMLYEKKFYIECVPFTRVDEYVETSQFALCEWFHEQFG